MTAMRREMTHSNTQSNTPTHTHYFPQLSELLIMAAMRREMPELEVEYNSLIQQRVQASTAATECCGH